MPMSARALTVCASIIACTSANAVDGCKLMLCLAAPKWQEIPMCAPTVREALHDIARGRPVPKCPEAEPAASTNHEWANAPGNCPPQYTHVVDGESAPIYSCDYTGVISVAISGTLFTRTWWSMTGDTVTEFTPEAKVQLGTWDTRFDDDYAAWVAALPPPPCTDC